MKKKPFIFKLWECFKSEPFYPFEIVDDEKAPHEYKLLTKGELTPITISAEEILSSNVIKRRIEPTVLLKIQRDFLNEQLKFKQYKIVDEIPRENKYTLSNADETIEMQGDDFCSNPYLITQTRAFDVFKITSNAFFKKGCAFQTVLTEEKQQQVENHTENKKDPIALKIIKGTEKKAT